MKTSPVLCPRCNGSDAQQKPDCGVDPVELRNNTIKLCAKLADQAAMRCVRERIPGDSVARHIAQNIRGLLEALSLPSTGSPAQASPDRQVALDSDGKPVYFAQSSQDRDTIARDCLRPLRGCATDEQYREALMLIKAALYAMTSTDGGTL